MPEIRIIQSSGSIPTVTQLPLGDIAINSYDGKAYIKQVSGSTQNIIQLGTGGASVSASYASTASYSFFAVTASFAQNFNPSATASYAISASYALTATTASYALVGLSSSFANTASYAISALSASYATSALSASYALNALSASFATTASYYKVFPFTGSALITGSLGITGSTSVNSGTLSVYKSGSTVVDIQGSQGQLFSIVDALSGSLMSVNDISGLPILEVFSDDRVVVGTYGTPGLTVTGSRVLASGSFTGSFTGSFLGTSSWASNAISSSYARTGSYINPLFQSVFISGSTEITGSTAIKGDVTVNSAATIDLNATTLNINAGTFQVPSFALPYSPSANVRVVMYDAVSNALFVTASAPAGAVITNFIATGSVTASVQIGPAATIPYFFLVQSGSAEMLKINAERVVVFESRTDTPTAVTGGLFYSASGDFFFGM